MRVCLFTDTLGDVNGVSRFVRGVAGAAARSGRDLRVITSTRLATPAGANVVNFEPVLAAKMPRYEHLEVVLPPVVRMVRHVARRRPDVIHVSTPGPVGVVGRLAARALRVPVLGVYHTDFPAYVERLFEGRALVWATERYMGLFYRRMRRVFTRSQDYASALVGMGMRRERVLALAPGVDTAAFRPRFRDGAVWRRVGVDERAVKMLYVGRVSVEKNLSLLARVWREASARLEGAGIAADLVVVGDGPYRAEMERALRGARARFLGFRHGEELSALYASSDLFVFPSVTDTLGQVVMEAQASGLPVLVSDAGGPKEVVREGETGFVLPAGAPERWVGAIVRLAGDAAVRQRMGAAAHAAMQGMSIERSFEHFWGAHVEAWHEHLAARGTRGRVELATEAR